MKKQKEFFIKGKQEITDTDAPVISDEFIDKTKEGDYIGQTIEVKSDTHLEADTGAGEPYILRTYEFKTNPELLTKRAQFPSAQEIFDQHSRGIAGMMWGDGMSPVTDIEPRIIFSKDKRKYLIMVWAKPSLGQVVLEKTNTLSEIARGKQNTNSV